MNKQLGLQTLSILLNDLKITLHKAESTYKQLENSYNQSSNKADILTKLRQESVNRKSNVNHIIIYTNDRRLVMLYLSIAIIIGIYLSMFIYTPTIWTFWGLIAMLDFVLLI